MQPIRVAFIADGERFIKRHRVPLIPFRKDERKGIVRGVRNGSLTASDRKRHAKLRADASGFQRAMNHPG
jgi:hypothetical protein